jgi:hypothetical protein
MERPKKNGKGGGKEKRKKGVKEKKKAGMYILRRVSQGIVLRYYSRDNEYGAPLVTGLLKQMSAVTYRLQKQ